MKATVQKICKYARDERDAEILAEVVSRNKELYEFEKMLERGTWGE